MRRALITAQTNGDLTFASFAGNSLTMLLFASGEPLGAVQREVENGLEFTRRVHFCLFADIMTTQLGLVRALRGQTADISSFGDEQVDERGFQQRLETDPRWRLPHVGTGPEAPGALSCQRLCGRRCGGRSRTNPDVEIPPFFEAASTISMPPSREPRPLTLPRTTRNGGAGCAFCPPPAT